ncbi:MAG: pyrroline-5-carboxylate reductase [Chloroflexi bacterium]|nr:pyrroline-5-carboxylate reductase [Chloroflexota bacterium]
MLNGIHIAFIGGGVMGEAIVNSLTRGSGVPGASITVAEPIAARRSQLAECYGVNVTASNADAVRQAGIVILSIKPQMMSAALNDLRGVVAESALIFSIAAGVPIRSIADVLGANQPIVRVMPNTPAQIGQGISVWTCTPAVNETQREQARLILTSMGEEIFMEGEHYLDMATALSGTGPAYVFLFMEALIDAGVHLGFSRSISERLVMQTIKGSVEYALHSKRHVAELRNQVTSPAGTTASALYRLEKGGLRTIISRAVWAAYERCIALGRIKKDD